MAADTAPAAKPSISPNILPALTPEQAHALAPKGLSWDEAGAWKMGYDACANAHRASIEALIDQVLAVMPFALSRLEDLHELGGDESEAWQAGTARYEALVERLAELGVTP